MGILNVTPDSFSDGGLWNDPERAVAHAVEMAEQGASIIDVGAESTRPGSSPVSAEEEIRRLKPVLRELIPVMDVPVSVDTMKPEVAEVCVSMGADIVNDVNGLRAPGMAEVCASAGVHVVIMHVPGPVESVHSGCMGDGFSQEIRDTLRLLTASALDAGIDGSKVILDSGIGFGKTPEQNMWILTHSSYFSDGYPVLTHSSYFSDGYPVLSASSRKRFLAEMFPGMDRDEASVAAAVRAAESGAEIVRVHDVAGVVRAMEGRFSR